MGRPGCHPSPSASCVTMPKSLTLSEFRLPALHLGTVSGFHYNEMVRLLFRCVRGKPCLTLI